MEFIDKTSNKVVGDLLVDTFLNSRWNIVPNRYSDINYSTERTHPFRLALRDPLRNQLLLEQKNLCCYCMRSIDENTTTLEHIVPKSTKTQVELDKYIHYPLIRDNVCLQSVFDSATVKLGTPQFPLEIAYENLTVSCKGDFPGGATYHICNHKRGNDFIEALFYISTINAEISYRKAGLLLSLNGSYDATITTLNLNYDSLERIRQVWYHISVEEISDILSATSEDRNTILTLNLISLPQARRIKLIADFKTETFWNMLMQYKWFHNYYRTIYPLETR
jgi:hypothetical protein